MQLDERTIAVTGASGALGSVLVRRLLDAGASVLALDLGEPPRVEHPRCLALGGIDAAEPESVGPALRQGVEAFGGLHGLVNVAGGFRWQTLADGSLQAWDWLYRINLRSAATCCKAALAHLGEGASIVNIGAIGALKAAAGMGAYAASKAGVHKLTESLAEELKPRGIRVNAVLPSIIDTPANRADMPDADFGAWVRPEELAEVVLFLLSPAASGVTGALLPVPGRV